MSTPVIHMESLTRRYGSRRGIENVSLSVPAGGLYGFLGPNGAGKTTAIRVLLGFLRPTAGSARVFGLDCWKRSKKIKAEVGSIPGDLRLYPWLTGKEALRLFGLIRRRDIRPRGTQLAEELELDLSVKVRQMSRGMRQKLGLILALAHDPALLVLDEPSSALDPLMQERIRAMLRRAAASGRTIFFSSHTLGEVEALCDRVAIVREGRIVADATLDELRSKARHEFVIRWRSPASETAPGVAPARVPDHPPDFVTLKEHRPDTWIGEIRDGSLTEMLKFLADKPVEDLRLARPDLETIFRRYYESAVPSA
jgi:ABC-2 type transport system ATP-binding protein